MKDNKPTIDTNADADVAVATLTIDIPEIMYHVTLDALPNGTKVADMTEDEKTNYIAKVTKSELAKALEAEKELQSSYVCHRYEAIRSSRTEFEEKTFHMQYSEYVAYSTNKKAFTPYVNTLAKVRGVPVSKVMEGIGSGIKAMATMHGSIALFQQEIWAAKSLEELRKVIEKSSSMEANSV